MPQSVENAVCPSPFALRLGLASVGLFLLLALAAHAQTPATPALSAALERLNSIKAEERAELKRELESHAKVLNAQSAVVKIVAKLVGPSVVLIEADLPPKASPQQIEETGSGAIIEIKEKYYVLTNRHVIKNAATEAIRIHLADGRLIHPTKALKDPDTDVAVMAVDEPDLIAASLGDSDQMEIGDFVLSVGSPYGLSNSVSFGIISAKGRRDLRLGNATIPYQDFLQTDASINPGSSGGPLVNLRGEIIGVNSAIATKTGHDEGIGFAIPINLFMNVGNQLIETGKVARAFLGVKLNSRFGPAMAAELGLPRPIGAHVIGITPNSPAEAARLQVGDVILEFNHTAVEDDVHLVNLVSLTQIGKKVSLLVFRDRKPLTLTVEVNDRSKFPQ